MKGDKDHIPIYASLEKTADLRMSAEEDEEDTPATYDGLIMRGAHVIAERMCRHTPAEKCPISAKAVQGDTQ